MVRLMESEECASCVRYQSDCDRLWPVLAETEEELMGWHMIGDLKS